MHATGMRASLANCALKVVSSLKRQERWREQTYHVCCCICGDGILCDMHNRSRAADRSSDAASEPEGRDYRPSRAAARACRRVLRPPENEYSRHSKLHSRSGASVSGRSDESELDLRYDRADGTLTQGLGTQIPF